MEKSTYKKLVSNVKFNCANILPFCGLRYDDV